MERIVNYATIIEDKVANGRGYGNHLEAGFKVGRESTFLVQMELDWNEMSDFEKGVSAHKHKDYKRLVQDMKDLYSAQRFMEQNGLAGFYLRLQTAEDVTGALRDYQVAKIRRQFYGD